MTQLLCPAVIGRDLERAALVEHLDGASGGTVVVLGDAGIGKSRLVRELAHEARDRGLPVFSGRAVAGGRPVPYRPLAEALAAGCRRSGPPQAVELAPYRSALGLLIPEWRCADSAASGESSVVLGEGVLRMLHVLGDGARVLLVIEDLHWADPESLAVLEYVADHAAEEQLVCVATCRPNTGSGADLARALAGRGSAAMLGLLPLSGAEVAEMARLCLGVPTLPEGLDDLLSRADGVPFLVEELLAGASDAGGLVREATGWVLRAGAGEVVPATFADGVAHRVRSLDPADRGVPGAAALLGRRVDVAVLAGVVGRAPADVLSVLDRCAALQLMTRDAGGYVFRHALTRDAALAGLVGSARVELARRAREVLASVHPGLPGPWGRLAADLSVLAGDPADAAELLLAAGRRAVADGALATAAAVLDEARSLIPGGSPTGVDVDELRVEVAATAGDVDTAFATGTRLVGRVTDPVRRARIHLRIAEAASTGTRWGVAQEQLTLARDLIPGDEVLLADVDAMGAHVLLGAAHHDDAERAARKALQVADRLDLPEVACRALEVLGRVARTRAITESASMFARQLDVATRHGLTLWTVRATHELGTIDLMTTNERGRLHRARELAAEAGALSTVATLDLQLAASGWAALDARGCLDAAQRCRHAARRAHLGLLHAEALNLVAGAHAIAGRRAEMERALAELVALDWPEADMRAAPASNRALFALLREDRSRAMHAYDETVSIVRGSAIVYARPWWHVWALLRTVTDDGGDRARDEVRPLSAADNVMQALLDYGDAVASGRRGHPKRAGSLFAAARATLPEPGFAAYRHLAERLVAECALADGWGDPVEWLGEAAGYFRRAGHEHIERACRSLLRKAGAALPRREHGHRHVPPALAALGITDREADVLALVVEGLTSKEIAARLYISVRTVDKHVERLLVKTGLSRRGELRTLPT